MRHLALLASLSLAACGTTTNVAPDAAPDVSTPVDATPDAPMDVAVDLPSDAPVDAPPAARRLVWERRELPSSGPFGRWGYMVAAVGDGTAYVFGGTTLTNAGGGTTSNDLWLHDGRGDAPTFTRLATTGDPPRRYCGCLGYIPSSRTVLMIGGRNPDEAPAETWSLSIETMAWQRVMAPETPGGVIGCAMAWSASRGALYHFGGAGQATGYSGRVSRFDPTGPRWVTLEAGGPRGRYDDAFVPMPDGRRLLMAAGSRSAMAGSGFYNDVWIFDTRDETWTQVMPEGDAPPGRRNPWVSVDADGNGIVMAMGSTGIRSGEVLADTWHLDLSEPRWTRLDLETLPEARGFITALPGSGAVRGYLTGGFDNEAIPRDLWRLREE